MIDRVTLLYSPTCPVCDACAKDIVPIAARENINIEVRRPLPSEKQHPGLRTPALFVPEGKLGFTQPTLLVGGGLIDWLEEKINGAENNH